MWRDDADPHKGHVQAPGAALHGVAAAVAAKTLAEAGCPGILVCDIDREGTRKGPEESCCDRSRRLLGCRWWLRGAGGSPGASARATGGRSRRCSWGGARCRPLSGLLLGGRGNRRLAPFRPLPVGSGATLGPDAGFVLSCWRSVLLRADRWVALSREVPGFAGGLCGSSRAVGGGCAVACRDGAYP